MEPDRHYLIVSPLAYTGRAPVFTYHHDAVLGAGQIVEVPLGRRRSLAVVRRRAEPPDFPTRPVGQIIDLPPLPPYLLELGDWLASYYAASPSAAWSALLPTGLARRRRAVAAAPAVTGGGLPSDPLTAEQSTALTAIRADHRPTQLIEGVTGSGKTRLYLELAAEALAAGRSVIVLVPEITLTPQLVGQFTAAFGEVVISTHSKLTEAQRHRRWQAALTAAADGQPRIAIGPRSSLFTPLHQLGLIIVDECHETSYKQDQHPRYDGLTTAAKLTQIVGGRLILGSATPALRERLLASTGAIGHVRLTARAGGQPQPTATIIDRRDKALFRRSRFISEPLLEALTQTLSEDRQSLLFINRRGSASAQICADCGSVSACPSCQLPLTFHADLMRLICHHCNFRRAPSAVCPACGSTNQRFLGGGTKRIEAEVSTLLPHARLARLDRDSSDRHQLAALDAGLRAGQIDILIGTQLVAKGWDLPLVDTVGVISADTLLQLPDYTAAERTYSLIAQVSGRAGRANHPGRVFIQTYTPEHPAILAAASHNPAPLIETELAQRQQLGYPPFVNLLKVSHDGVDRQTAMAACNRLAATLRRRDGLTVVGPAPAFLETLGGRYRWQLIIKSTRRSSLVEIAQSLPDTWTADLDPSSLL